MSQKRRGLGKGLGELGLNELLGNLKDDVPISDNATPNTIPPIESEYQFVEVDQIAPGKYQPRKAFSTDDLHELADSIRAQGILQPIILRRFEEDRYEIIAGERRWRAAKIAGLEKIPAIIREISDQSALAMSLIENIQRRDLNVIEEAQSLQRLIDEFHLTHQEIATAVGKSRANISNLLRLLKLEPAVMEMVEQNEIEMGHARALLALEGAKQREIALEVVAKKLSVRETERLIRNLLHHVDQPETFRQLNEAMIARQARLTALLNTKVRINHEAKGKGKLIIHYKNEDELNIILDRIQ